MPEDRKPQTKDEKKIKMSPAFWAEKEAAIRSVWQIFKRDLLEPLE